MSFLGELAAILNIGNEIQKSRYVSGESPFDIHISSPQEAEYDLKKIRFIVAVEQDLYDYGNQTDKPEKTIVPIVRNVVHGDEILKGKAYLYTITNTKRISFAIHNIQFSDLSVQVDLAR